MAISDAFIGGYHLGMMVIVYAMLVLPVAGRGLVRRLIGFHPRGPLSRMISVLGLVGCSAVASTLFFAVTNLGHWYFYEMYPMTMEGLCHCYVQAIPFFRYTLSGDILFGSMLFGISSLVSECRLAPERMTQQSQQGGEA